MPRFTATRDALYSLCESSDWKDKKNLISHSAALLLWQLQSLFFFFSPLLPALLGPFLLNANLHYFVRDKLSWLNFNNWIITNILCEELLQVSSLWNWTNRQVPDQKGHTSRGLAQGPPNAFKWLVWGSAVPVIQAVGHRSGGHTRSLRNCGFLPD